MDIKVRKAGPADARFLAQVMYDSMVPGTGRGIFDAALAHTGVDPITFHEALLTTGSNNWGQLDSFLIMETPDQPLAGAMGYYLSSMPDLRPLTGVGFKTVAAHFEWPQPVAREFWQKYVSFFGLFGNAPQLSQPGEYVLEYAAVDSNLRGRGIYGRLLEAHERQAGALGHKTLGGTAIFGNDSVMRALTKFGFRECARYGPEYYRGTFPGLIRLIKEVAEPGAEARPE